jgi:hypothetical protein
MWPCILTVFLNYHQVIYTQEFHSFEDCVKASHTKMIEYKQQGYKRLSAECKRKI